MTLQRPASSRPAHSDASRVTRPPPTDRPPRHAGRVDNRTTDGAVVLVVSDGRRRQLFHVADRFD